MKVDLYYKLLLRYRVACLNIWFNQQCKKFGVFPKYINIKSSSNSYQAKKAIEAAKRRWRDEETKKWFNIRDSLSHYRKFLHVQLTHELHPVHFDILDDKIRSTIADIINEKKDKQNKKLNKLININNNNTVEYSNKIIPKVDFYPRVMNLSNSIFNDIEIELLNKGLKYNPFFNINNSDIDHLIIDSDIAIKQINNSKLNQYKIANLIKNYNFKNNNIKDATLVKNIKNKCLKENLTLTKADKGNTLVILNKRDYIDKVMELINNNNFVLINTDPTFKFQTKVKELINNLQFLFTNFEKSKLIEMNPRTPILYGLPKIHKDNLPIRPIVSFIGSPTYKLATKLNAKFKELVNFKASHSVINSLELVEKIKNIKLNNRCKFYSLDITNLFTNIPVTQLLPLIHKILKRHICNPLIINELLEAFEICINQNYFKFEDLFYCQPDGLAMGSPLSPSLSEIFMDDFETDFLNNNVFKLELVYYWRYVDDIFICWQGTDRQFDIFCNNINSVNQKIKFTVEKELNNSINFLDLSIKRVDNSHEFSIFRKPTYTDTVIHNSSNHPIQHKLAAFNSMVHRLLSVPLNHNNFNKELNTIKNIAINNGYKVDLINKLINNKLHKTAINEIYPKANKVNNKYIILPFLGDITYKIANKLKHPEFNIAFKTCNNIKKCLVNNKDKINKFDKSGVYRLICDSCDAFYVGQTGRAFNTRIKEHKKSFEKRKLDSTFAAHLFTENHTSSFAPEILHLEEKGRRLDLLEAHEIMKERNSPKLLNEITEMSKSPLIGLEIKIYN